MTDSFPTDPTLPNPTPPSPTISVVVVDDQWMIREGLASLAGLDDDIQVVATAADGAEAVALAEQHRPNVMLMDIRMPNLDGIETTRRIKKFDGRITVLMLTTFEDRDLIERSLTAGAAGYLTKDIAAADLANSIRSAAAGVVQLTPQVTKILLEGATTARAEPEAAVLDASPLPAGFEGLSPRERDVLRLVAKGLNNREIGTQLHLSAGTVKNHVSAILRNLGTTDRTEAAVLATKHGLI